MLRTIGAIDAGEGRKVPWIRLRGSQPGPTALITANVHGDEVTGVATIHRLDAYLRDNLGAGEVVLYPTLNPMGLEQGTRHLPQPDADLNRLFPGGRRKVEDRLAATLWRHFEGHSPDMLLDLHADSADAVPYAIVDRPVRLSGAARRDMGERLEALAAASGLLVLREYPDDQYLRYSLDRSLAGAMVNRLQIPAVTLEVGPRRYAHPVAVQQAFDAAVGVLAAAGHLAATSVREPYGGGPWRRAAAPRVRQPGLFMADLRPGERFEKGARLGVLHDLTGVQVEEIRSTSGGVVVSWQERSWVGTGGVVGTLGVLDR